MAHSLPLLITTWHYPEPMAGIKTCCWHARLPENENQLASGTKESLGTTTRVVS